ncbi:MAG: glycosyltransferase family 2 protein [Lentisphaeria bacterium]|nr:glycosyltransferase family 2 protein [Lentisphaeria bacterium]
MTKYFLIAGLAACLLLFINFPVAFSYFSLLNMLILAIMAFTYRNSEEKYEKKCDIIIPAYNEGRHIYETVKSVLASNYKNINVVVIDDGSSDDTRYWMKLAEKSFPGMITAVYFDQNRGKKHALAAGIRASNADVIITIDSDSVVDKDAIANIIKPFANPQVGAVAGNINVQNLNQGLIPKLMDIIFVFSYELLRSAQSQFGSVMCTPGALSAYRRSAVEPVLEEWLEQKFLGNYTSIGEDRALTCLLIRGKWDVVYQESAKAFTNMPVRYKDLCRMLLRWVRGDIRENILLSPYVVKNTSFSDPKSLGLIFHFIVFNIGTFSPIIILPLVLAYYVVNFSYFLAFAPYILLVMVLWSILPMLVYMRKKTLKYAFHSITYSIFSLILLSWIPCWAILTLNNNKWLTRGGNKADHGNLEESGALQAEKIS